MEHNSVKWTIQLLASNLEMFVVIWQSSLFYVGHRVDEWIFVKLGDKCLCSDIIYVNTSIIS